MLYPPAMKPLLATLLLALAPLSACVSPDREVDDPNALAIVECDPGTVSRPDLEQIEVYPDTVLAEPAAPDRYVGPIDQRAFEAPALEACDCADDGCLIDWIDENLGCGVCATFVCGDGPVGGCVPCPQPTDEGGAAGEPCLLPPSDEVAR